VGEHSMVGTGAIVTSNVEPYHVVVGVPAKSVKIKTPRNSEVSALAGE
jgi:acetyltransferase-like isoleucine patch superfamily enzyme